MGSDDPGRTDGSERSDNPERTDSTRRTDDPERTDDEAPDGAAVDPVTVEVVRNALAAVAEEMNANLVRSGYSPNIKERRDCSCALFDATGEMASQAETMPVHLGAMPFSVAAALERFPPETLEPGDAVLLNDPFHGGAHLPDLTLLTPIFDGDELVAFAANRAHHADVGGARAGSVAADSTEIYQEGLRLPPVKLYDRGELVDAVSEILLANVRTPDERRGDLRAQHAANETGRRRVAELLDRYGRETLLASIGSVQDYAERRMQSAIADLPDGAYEATDVLDGDGRGSGPVRIEVTVTIDGESIVVDFEGSDPQTKGPINAVFAVTASATYYAVRCLTDPAIPANAGAYRPIEIETPAGSVVDARPPAAVVGGNLETSQRVTDVVLRALASVAPQRAMAAGQGTMNNVTFGGLDTNRDDRGRKIDGNNRPGREGDGRADPEGDSRPGRDGESRPNRDGADRPDSGAPFAFYETIGGGFGARADGDGMDGVHVHMSNTMNTPAEVLETAYPLSVERYAYRPETGGAGRFRGGFGIVREIRVREGAARVAFSLLADRRDHAPYGLYGGEKGATGRDELVQSDTAAALPAKGTRELEPGDVVRIATPGGGGYGDPIDRDPAAVRRDVESGLIGEETAEEVYGVAIDTDRS